MSRNYIQHILYILKIKTTHHSWHVFHVKQGPLKSCAADSKNSRVDRMSPIDYCFKNSHKSTAQASTPCHWREKRQLHPMSRPSFPPGKAAQLPDVTLESLLQPHPRKAGRGRLAEMSCYPSQSTPPLWPPPSWLTCLVPTCHLGTAYGPSCTHSYYFPALFFLLFDPFPIGPYLVSLCLWCQDLKVNLAVGFTELFYKTLHESWNLVLIAVIPWIYPKHIYIFFIYPSEHPQFICSKIFEWHKHFKEGCMCMNDNPGWRDSEPMAVIPVNIQRVNWFLKTDR